MDSPLPFTRPVSPQAAVKPAQGLARASLVLGVFSALGGGLLVVPPVLAVVLGHIALGRSRSDPARGGHGLAIGGLVTGYFGFVVLFLGIMGVLAFQLQRATDRRQQPIQDESMRLVMSNTGRMVAMGVQQEMLEQPGPVEFSIDPATGQVGGSLARYVSRVPAGVVVVDGLIEDSQDGFSLQDGSRAGGRVYYFDGQGSLLRSDPP